MSCCGAAKAGWSTAVTGTLVGVRFGEETNLTPCDPAGDLLAAGAEVVVEVDGEPRLGRVEQSPLPVARPCQRARARPVLRRASTADREAHEKQRALERSAKQFCHERALALDLEMNVSRVHFTLSRKRATVLFTAEKRVDFRQLVRELSQRFGARVQMVQVGARDEARQIGGLGVCGLTLCCASWLGEFRPIGIGMAKRQNLSLNPAKISGQCGRLLCCLAYEDEEYRRGGTTRPATPLPAIP